LGDFLKPLAQFFFKKRAQKFGSILGDFLKRVKILIFNVINTLASKEKLRKFNFLEKFLKKLSRNMGNFGPNNLFGKQNLVTSQGLGQLLEAV